MPDKQAQHADSSRRPHEQRHDPTARHVPADRRRSAAAPAVNAFYDIVETHPDGAPVHALHQNGFGVAHLREVQFEFLCGFLGGPRYYAERMGHSNLRHMHAHVAIGQAEVVSWLRCMVHAIEAADIPMDVAPKLMQHLTRAAEALKNRP